MRDGRKEVSGNHRGDSIYDGESVELEKLAAALELEKEQTRELLGRMIKRYEDEAFGVQIIELDGSYQMCTKTEMYEYLIRVAKQPKRHVLTDVLLETLSIITYKQPITKQEIEKIRGVSCDHAVNKLVEYRLVCELGPWTLGQTVVVWNDGGVLKKLWRSVCR